MINNIFKYYFPIPGCIIMLQCTIMEISSVRFPINLDRGKMTELISMTVHNDVTSLINSILYKNYIVLIYLIYEYIHKNICQINI